MHALSNGSAHMSETRHKTERLHTGESEAGCGMDGMDKEAGALQRDQQLLREKIAESDRLIQETDQRLAASRSYTDRQNDEVSGC